MAFNTLQQFVGSARMSPVEWILVAWLLMLTAVTTGILFKIAGIQSVENSLADFVETAGMAFKKIFEAIEERRPADQASRLARIEREMGDHFQQHAAKDYAKKNPTT